MNSDLLLLMLAALLLSVPAHAVTIDWVTVGNPGNDPDPQTGSLYGAVNYEYRIAKHLVTIQQYTDFLNAVAQSDPYSLYNPSMASDLNIAGISRSGTSGAYTYSVINNGGPSGNRPITYVSWFDAARFANWMHNGQGKGDTETGAYMLVDGQTSGTAPGKNTGAAFYVPTENEWYKAAYYSPGKGGGGAPGYYIYGTQSDSAPGNTIGNGANQANFRLFVSLEVSIYSVTQSSFYSPSQNYLTDVGAFTNSSSYYGTFDQSGNVVEWNDLTSAPGLRRGLMGGRWSGGVSGLSSFAGGVDGPAGETNAFGFRLASPVPVPEPSSWVMAGVGLACAGWGAVRCRRARKTCGIRSTKAFAPAGTVFLPERRRRSERRQTADRRFGRPVAPTSQTASTRAGP
jgi:sulfatase modifying factor 1